MRIRIAAGAAVLTSLAALPWAGAATTSPAPGYGTTWVVNSAANSVLGYAAGASGAASPIVTIKGAATGLHAPSAIAVSSTGKLFVANAGSDSVTEYAANATGNTAPIATIVGSKTGLDGPSSIALAGGDVWVTDPNSNVVESFTQGESGNILPAESLAGHRTKLDHPVAIAVSDNDFLPSITVINRPIGAAANIVSFFTDKRGDVKPQGQVMGTHKHKLVSPTAIMASGFASYWIADSGTNSVLQAFAFPGIPRLHTTRLITGARTGLDDPTGLSHDALGRLVVSNAGDHTLRVFGASANGNATPTRTLTGVGAGSGDPAATAVYGVPPGAPTHLKVSLHHTDASMRWKAPSFTGGGVAGYLVEKFRDDSIGGGFVGGGEVIQLVSILGGGIGNSGLGITTRKTSATKHNIKPGHRYEFLVAAVNGFGTSSFIHVTKAHVLPPSPARRVRALAGRHSLVMQWNPSKDDGGGHVHYNVQYAAGCAPGSKGCKTHHQVTGKYDFGFLRIGGLKRHTTYQVRVIARNKKGSSKPSKILRATTQ